MVLAKFKCVSCLHEWQAHPGYVVCPTCKGKYMHWDDYKQTFGQLIYNELPAYKQKNFSTENKDVV